MPNATIWTPKNELRATFLKGVERLSEQYKEIEAAMSEDMYQLDKTTYHFVAKLLKGQGNSRGEKALLSHVFGAAYQAEILSQGAGFAVFVFAMAFAKSLLKSKNALKNNDFNLLESFSNKISKVKLQIESHSRIANKTNLTKGIQQACNDDEVLTQVVLEAVNLAGLEGKIFIENGKQSNYFVELKEGYSFATSPFKFFLDPKSATWEKPKCKVLIVDGLIEKVSELDHILNKTYETKQPLVIVAQGFSEEVVATLKANQERGNFDSLPVRVMPDLESLNMINDISVACGTLPVSSLKGDLICFVKYEDLPVVDMVRCTRKEMSIENVSSRSNVSNHIRSLLEKRQAQTIDDLQNLIDKRLKSMVASSVTINLPNVSSMVVDGLRVKLDNALRITKTILNYGVVDLTEIIDDLPKKDDLDQAIFDGIQAITSYKNELPTLSAVVSTILSGKSVLMLLTSNGMVELTAS